MIPYIFWGGKYMEPKNTKPVELPTITLAGASRPILGLCDWMCTTPVTNASSGLARANHEISNESVTQKVMFKM